MKYISLHKSKAKRAYKGGKIIKIRLATESEIIEHQVLMIKNNKEHMKSINNRKIIIFKYNPDWSVIWPTQAKSNSMA